MGGERAVAAHLTTGLLCDGLNNQGILFCLPVSLSQSGAAPHLSGLEGFGRVRVGVQRSEVSLLTSRISRRASRGANGVSK